MIREILFKAKPKDWKEDPQNTEWIIGYYLQRQETTYCFKEEYPVKTLHFIAEECMTDWGLPNDFMLIEIDPDTLCQYVGIEDRNEENIWENDIVCYEDIHGKSIGVIVYRDDSFFLEWKIGKNKIYRRDLLRTWTTLISVEGNVFDNPELLEGDAENE